MSVSESSGDVQKSSLKGTLSTITGAVSNKLNTTPKKIAAVIGGSAVAGAAIATSPIWVSIGLLAAAGGLIGGTIGVGISGVYLSYKGTKKAAEGLADSPKFQNAMGALSVGKLIDKVFERSAKNKVKSDFKSDLKKEMKQHKKNIDKYLKDNPLSRPTSEWKPTTENVKKFKTHYEKKYNNNLGSADDYLTKKELEEFKELKGSLDKLLNNYNMDVAFEKYAFKQKPVDKNKKPIKDGKANHDVGVDKLAKLMLYMTLIDSRSKAKEAMDAIKEFEEKNLKPSDGMTIDKEKYQKYIKPIEKYLIKDGERKWNNFDPTKLTGKDCNVIMKHIELRELKELYNHRKETHERRKGYEEIK